MTLSSTSSPPATRVSAGGLPEPGDERSEGTADDDRDREGDRRGQHVAPYPLGHEPPARRGAGARTAAHGGRTVMAKRASGATPASLCAGSGRAAM
jgi:hypothetical protein